MSSRQEQKQRAREARIAQEEADRRAAARRKRIQVVFGGVLGLAAIAAIVVAVAVGLGGDDSGSGPKQAGAGGADGLPRLPEARETELAGAAKAAGCKVTNAKFEGQDHEQRKFTAADYDSNPPTSGNHTPNHYEDGIYIPGTTPDLGQTVHTLEHGRINLQYRPRTAKQTVAQLESFVAENEGYHMLMFENATEMPAAVAATGWTQMLSCETVNDRTWDALRTFRDKYLDKGPEKVP